LQPGPSQLLLLLQLLLQKLLQKLLQILLYHRDKVTSTRYSS
jgi:hypothetical protein